MRAYYFGNMYLSSIQQGIQAAHVTHELFLKYQFDETLDHTNVTLETLYKWAGDHKTMILLNGGYSDNLRKLINTFSNRQNPYPWAYFNEGQDSLDGALTCVGIVLPETIYTASAAFRVDPTLIDSIRDGGYYYDEEDKRVDLSKWEFELCQELNNYSLAS